MNFCNQVYAIYAYFIKAFEKTDNNILLEKITGVGVLCDLLRLFIACICSRS